MNYILFALFLQYFVFVHCSSACHCDQARSLLMAILAHMDAARSMVQCEFDSTLGEAKRLAKQVAKQGILGHKQLLEIQSLQIQQFGGICTWYKKLSRTQQFEVTRDVLQDVSRSKSFAAIWDLQWCRYRECLANMGKNCGLWRSAFSQLNKLLMLQNLPKMDLNLPTCTVQKLRKNEECALIIVALKCLEQIQSKTASR